ncbi:hypothetical protein ACVXHA_04215 [Escherichia coli]
MKVASWGEIVEVESHFDYYRPVQRSNWAAAGWRVLWPWCAYDDEIISLFGRPDYVAYDIRSLRNKANPDDTFEGAIRSWRPESHCQNQPSGENRLSEIYRSR